MSRTGLFLAMVACLAASVASAQESYTNFEVSHVHPIALSPSGDRLFAVNTPDSRLEVFAINDNGYLVWEDSFPVGLEPVTVRARSDSEAWVVSQLSDSITIVDVDSNVIARVLNVGDEPTDVVFASNKAFVSISQEDRVRVYDLADLDAPPISIDLFGDSPRALAVSPSGNEVYAVVLHSGNQTTALSAAVVASGQEGADVGLLTELGLNDASCSGPPHPYPPLPAGLTRNPALTDPADGIPPVGLIVRWNEALTRWEDEAGQDWTHCVPFRLPDHDLFSIDTTTLAVSTVSQLGTILFDVSVNPVNGKVYVANHDARNFVRFEHPLGVAGHVVDQQLTIVDPAQSNAVTKIDLNDHIDRESDPSTNLSEREASVSQPGMMVWRANGTQAFMTAFGSRKVFRIDGTCTSPACIFGAARATPDAVDVGHGPSGVALLEPKNRLYVLNRIDNNIVSVDTASLSVVDSVALLDPTPLVVREGRILLNDAIATSGHGDASCATCHISADLDGLAWDLGDPEGSMVPYGIPGDNVRFIRQNPINNDTEPCANPTDCSDHLGFDPQKGPMTTQTLRSMIEPLHWRGDRGTILDFNPAFVALLGAEDVGPVNGRPAGLSLPDMQKLGEFLHGIRMPPNPHRPVDDVLANQVVVFEEMPVDGNPFAGEQTFLNHPADTFLTCVSCHSSEFGTSGGKLGGIMPGDDPELDWAALFRGNNDQSPHNDLKIPQLRNMYQKPGAVAGPPGAPNDAKSGFGYSHDGSVQNLPTFLSRFSVDADQVKNLSAFLMSFPTETRPAVGRQLTIPAGTPPTGTAEQESLLTTLLQLGDASDANRHCDLIASVGAPEGARTFRFASNGWEADVSAQPVQSTTAFREQAGGPITFLCSTIGSSLRLGLDRDGDGVFNGDDCASADAQAFAPPAPVDGVTVVSLDGTVRVEWADQSTIAGEYARYEVFGGRLIDLQTAGLDMATECLAGDIAEPRYDASGTPAPAGDGFFYLIRAVNECGDGGFQHGRAELSDAQCSASGFAP